VTKGESFKNVGLQAPKLVIFGINFKEMLDVREAIDSIQPETEVDGDIL